MTDKEKRRFTVISNPNIDTSEQKSSPQRDNNTTPPDIIGYQTNPMYEKLLNFKELQKKKRFTVEDLLKW